MMTCREMAALLIDLVSEELAAETRMLAEQHFSVCPSCVAYVESYRLTIQMSRQLPRADLPASMQQRLEAMLQEHLTDKTESRLES